MSKPKEDKPFGVTKTNFDIDGNPIPVKKEDAKKKEVKNDKPKIVKKRRRFIGVLPDREFG
jgi:hypothetical protein